MPAAKLETAAAKYRRIKEERLKGETLFDVETPSGMVWKLRKPNLAQFITSGVMPMSLAGKLAKAAEAEGDGAKAFASLEFDDQVRTVDFSAKVVRFCAVEPKIVEVPKEPNDIGYDEVELDDFNFIFAWAMPGGSEADGLANFRKE